MDHRLIKDGEEDKVPGATTNKDDLGEKDS